MRRSPVPRCFARAFALGSLGVLMACSSAPSVTPSDGGFPAQPLDTLDSESGRLHLELRSSPQPVVRGTNDAELTVTDARTGAPQEGLTITVAPWMPSMNHGSSNATVTALGGGKYHLADVYLYMPGLWELETTFTGPVSDHAQPTVQVP